MHSLLAIIIALLSILKEETQYTIPNSLNKEFQDSIPSFLKGEFKDDYGIRYTINDSDWVQHPTAIYHILQWNEKEQYLLVRNDLKNPSEKGLHSRIDYMRFSNMQPWNWGFCLTVFDAISLEDAEKALSADRQNPKKGCNGFPFSRMKNFK